MKHAAWMPTRRSIVFRPSIWKIGGFRKRLLYAVTQRSAGELAPPADIRRAEAPRMVCWPPFSLSLYNIRESAKPTRRQRLTVLCLYWQRSICGGHPPTPSPSRTKFIYYIKTTPCCECRNLYFILLCRRRPTPEDRSNHGFEITESEEDRTSSLPARLSALQAFQTAREAPHRDRSSRRVLHPALGRRSASTSH